MAVPETQPDHGLTQRAKDNRPGLQSLNVLLSNDNFPSGWPLAPALRRAASISLAGVEAGSAECGRIFRFFSARETRIALSLGLGIAGLRQCHRIQLMV